jgi:hypothetical protein
MYISITIAFDSLKLVKLVTCTTHTGYIGVKKCLRTYTRYIGFKSAPHSYSAGLQKENGNATNDRTPVGRTRKSRSR